MICTGGMPPQLIMGMELYQAYWRLMADYWMLYQQTWQFMIPIKESDPK